MISRDRYKQSTSWLDSYNERIKYQDSMRELLSGRTWSHFVTITFNQATTMWSQRRHLDEFHKQLDRKLYGKNFYKRAAANRTFFMAFPEFASAPHWHAFFLVEEHVRERFEQNVEPILKSVIKASDQDVQVVMDQLSKERIASYITKALWKPSSIESFIVSSEFIRQPATISPSR